MIFWGKLVDFGGFGMKNEDWVGLIVGECVGNWCKDGGLYLKRWQESG